MKIKKKIKCNKPAVIIMQFLLIMDRIKIILVNSNMNQGEVIYMRVIYDMYI